MKSHKINKFDIIVIIFYMCASIFSDMLELINLPGVISYIISAIFIVIHFFKCIEMKRINTYVYYFIISFFLLPGVVRYSSRIGVERCYLIIYNFYIAYYVFRHISIDAIFIGFRVYSYLSLFFYLPQAANYNNQLMYMDFAYNILLPMCFLAYDLFEKKNIFKFLLLAASTVCLLIFGCRGALVAFILFIIYTVVFNDYVKHRFLWIVGSLIVLLLLYFNLDSILDILQSYGYSSRTIDKLLSGTFTQSTSRDDIYETCINLIKQYPLGMGILGSRRFFDPYCHSIIYEILIDVGYIFGPMILLYVFFLCFKGLFKVNNKQYRLILSILIICGMIRLLLSSSLYHNFYIPAIMALINSFNMLPKGERDD